MPETTFSVAMNRRRMLSATLRFGALLPFGQVLSANAETLLPPGASLGIASVPNLRDIGGYPAYGGKVVQRGLAYRSEKLNPITAADRPKIAALGLRQVFDLRTKAEREIRPDELPGGVEDVWLDVLGNTTLNIPPNIVDLLNEPKKANALFGDGKLAGAVDRIYRQFITLPSARTAYGGLFTHLAAEEGDGSPALFHCTAGKDRTGWATAALLTQLGVPRDLVFQDYLRTNDYILPEYKTYIDRFVANGGDPSVTDGLFGAKAEYLQAAFDEMESRYGSVASYFSNGLGIDAMGQARLHAYFLAIG